MQKPNYAQHPQVTHRFTGDGASLGMTRSPPCAMSAQVTGLRSFCKSYLLLWEPFATIVIFWSLWPSSSDDARSAAANDNRASRPNRVVLRSADKAGIFLFWMLAWTISGLLLALMMRYT